MDYHPIANTFPLINGERFTELVETVKELGLLEPIVLYEDKILDGRNRYRACIAAEVEPRFVQYDGDDPFGFVVAMNLARRHLDEAQRAMCAARVANMKHGGDRKSKIENQEANWPLDQTEKKPEPQPKITLNKAAEQFNVSERSIKRARTVQEKGVPELAQAVDEGKVSLNAASAVSELPREEQVEVVARGEEEILRKAKEIRMEKAKQNQAERKEKQAEALKIKPPKNSYRTIVIDPPWDMQKIERDVTPNQVGFDYPTMSEEELESFHIPADTNCHIYLWTTQKFLPMAFRLLDRWGFKYIFTMVWHKPGGFQPFGLPQYNCEFVLFGRKGNMDFLDTKQFFCAFNAPRREHSRKPDEFYQLVKRVSPEPRIDIFSREKREGFDQYGNETELFSDAG